MRFTLNLSMLPPRWQVELAVEAERLGFFAVSVGDSIFYPKHSSSEYPYTASGDRTFLEGQPFADPLVIGGAILERTERLRFQISVLKLTVRHPVLVAKQAATLATVSGNRLKLGVGMSPWPEDYEVLDVPYQGRGQRFDEAIELLRDLTAGGYVSSPGPSYGVPLIRIDPVPSDRIPLLIGGHSEKNLRRAAKHADGWIAAGSDWSALESMISFIDEERSRMEMRGEFEVHASGQKDRSILGVRRLAELGVTDVNFRPAANSDPASGLDDLIQQTRLLADGVLG